MIAAVDLFYDELQSFARAACVIFADPRSDAVREEAVVRVSPIADYEPGEFYRRELPCTEAVLAPRLTGLDAVIIDGYVQLSKDGRPGLGWHVHQRFAIPVIGVAGRFPLTPVRLESLTYVQPQFCCGAAAWGGMLDC